VPGSEHPDVLVVIGTRPELIKQAPLVLELRRRGVPTRVVATGQHARVLDPLFEHFGVTPDATLDLPVSARRSLNHLCAEISLQLDAAMPATTTAVVVQGDTTSALAGALTAFHRRTPVVHLEAGLRTGDLASPFPEEGNRRLIGQIAALHLAPTSRARDALLREGVDPERVRVTGNTVIDALLLTDRATGASVPRQRRSVLVTAHRRESWGHGFTEILSGVSAAARRHAEVDFRWVAHPNAELRQRVDAALGGLANVQVDDALPYPQMVGALRRCTIVLTDSGGLQEEAPTFGKPVLVMRDTTERPEAVEAGCARLVGSSAAAIEDGVSALLTDPVLHARMSTATNPYGDGRAAQRAADAIIAAHAAPPERAGRLALR